MLSDLEFWAITKPLALFNLYSRGNYYVNVVFFNLLTFWGQYLVFKLFAARFPGRRRGVYRGAGAALPGRAEFSAGGRRPCPELRAGAFR